MQDEYKTARLMLSNNQHFVNGYFGRDEYDFIYHSSIICREAWITTGQVLS